ncbi:MAG: type I DNA topoisomerase, partial [Planctomycetes bacterium]|nr:type I DNA topoisomerase [Planctomycetota bacterium]
PDPDREGEAIAWHLKEALALDEDRTFRVTFGEITKRAIQEAFAKAGRIDMDKVNAQQTRRFLDRVVGYQLSPLLWKKVAKRLSAGRVQSVAVRLIVDREKEIQAFKPEEYWRITATLRPQGAKKKQDQFEAELAEWDGRKFACGNEETAKGIVEQLQPQTGGKTAAPGVDYRVRRITQKDKVDKPAPPFETSSLQQQASVRLRFSTKKTMFLAQQLYEGVELGTEGAVGLITYMRTDSLHVAAEAIAHCRQLIGQQFGPKYLPEKPNRYQAGRQSQEAHEAIRPTDVSYTPQRVQPHLTRDQYRLYELVYNRFVASQMTPAVLAITDLEVEAAQGLFKAQGRQIKFDGYRRVFPPAGKQEDTLLPPLAEGQLLDCLKLEPTQHFTQPPPRYTEATLVKALKKENIGRPSTYAPIISTIQNRGYVEQKERRFYATELGMVVTDLLVKHFPKIMDLKFTSHMEDELDQVANAHLDWQRVLSEFYDPFQEELRRAEVEMEKVRGVETEEKCPECGKALVVRWAKTGKFLGCSGYPECKFTKPLGEEARPEPVETEHACPECGKPMLLRHSRRGPFLGCSGYPECKVTMNLDAQGNAVRSQIPTEHKCDKCGAPMVLRQGRRGPFLGCSAYPKCRNIKEVDAEGNPVEPIRSGIACEKCGAEMIVKRGPRGSFLGCSAYPKCRSTKPLPEELKEQLAAQRASQPRATGNGRAGRNGNGRFPSLKDLGFEESCEDCGKPMALRAGRRGPFLGCTGYPRCRHTREAPPEILEAVAANGGGSGEQE